MLDTLNKIMNDEKHMTYSQYLQHRQMLEEKKKDILEESKVFACYFCYAHVVGDGSCCGGDGLTCPKCGVVALIGDGSGLPIGDAGFLSHMHFYAFDHVVLGNGGLTVKKDHCARWCWKCMMVNYLEHIRFVVPDRKIVIAELECFGGPCPWQWEGKTDDGVCVYIRERGGVLRIDLGGVVWLMLRDYGDFDGYLDLVRLTGEWVSYPEDDGEDAEDN